MTYPIEKVAAVVAKHIDVEESDNIHRDIMEGMENWLPRLTKKEREPLIEALLENDKVEQKDAEWRAKGLALIGEEAYDEIYDEQFKEALLDINVWQSWGPGFEDYVHFPGAEYEYETRYGTDIHLPEALAAEIEDEEYDEEEIASKLNSALEPMLPYSFHIDTVHPDWINGEVYAWETVEPTVVVSTFGRVGMKP